MGAGSVKCLENKHEDLRLIPGMHRKLGVVTCSPSTGEADGRLPEAYSSQPSPISESQVPVRSPVSKSKVDGTPGEHWRLFTGCHVELCSSGRMRAHTHIHTLLYIHTKIYLVSMYPPPTFSLPTYLSLV